MAAVKKILFLVCLLICSTTVQAQEDSASAIPPITADSIIRIYINAIGGEAVIYNIKDIKTIRTAVVQQIPITITEMKKQPDKLKITLEGINMVLQKVVVNKNKGYQENQGVRSELSPIEVNGTRAEADLLSKLRPADYGITREYKGIQQVDTFSTYLVEETDMNGKLVQYYYDIKSGLLVRKASNEMTPQGPTPTITTYTDYKNIPRTDGFKIPGTIRQEIGMQAVTSTLKNVEINKNIPDKEFE